MVSVEAIHLRMPIRAGRCDLRRWIAYMTADTPGPRPSPRMRWMITPASSAPITGAIGTSHSRS